MKDSDILKILNEITPDVWTAVIKKCHVHMGLKLKGKTASGAHCQQRLGMDATDYYMGEAIKGLYGGIWEWKYKQYSIDEQLIRIIDSMISEQVRKYKVEMKKGKITQLVANDQLALSLEEAVEEEYDETELQKFSEALNMACENNEKYKRLVELKQQNLNYADISKMMECTKDELYQMMENISKRANRILKSL
jgi:DNA-directed RNA polymerase specialized sigma24 family protein